MFIYDPELHKLFSGSEREKQNILQIGLSDSRRRNLLQAIRHNKEQKRGNLMRVVYPQLDLGFIQMIIEEQVVQNADILTCPTVPLTSKENFELQISKFTEMAQEGLAVTENLIRKELKRETMVVLTVQPRVVRPETTSTLVETLVSLGCRHIGIKPLDDPYKDSTNARALHNLIEQIRKQADPKTRIYFMNVLEAGYTAFAFGADVVTMTTGYPYFVPPDEERKNGRESYGRWYNPKAMLWVERTEALEASRTHNYLIPCSCGASQEVRTFLSVDKAPDWNRYRKAHYCLVKNDEARMLQNAEVPLRHAIREMFARSENVMPIALIP
ncbi:MAG: hypothetical protein HY558_08120 [Euryarchaeota archaeon]|nr:hypothetical protein [Euryarchaeota archaeon]